MGNWTSAALNGLNIPISAVAVLGANKVLLAEAISISFGKAPYWNNLHLGNLFLPNCSDLYTVTIGEAHFVRQTRRTGENRDCHEHLLIIQHWSGYCTW
jgi:hypothetical protein